MNTQDFDKGEDILRALDTAKRAVCSVLDNLQKHPQRLRGIGPINSPEERSTCKFCAKPIRLAHSTDSPSYWLHCDGEKHDHKAVPPDGDENKVEDWATPKSQLDPTAGRDYIHFEMPPLAPATVKLVLDFAKALADKLSAAEVKYGYGDSWATPDAEDWPNPLCYDRLMEHLAKGDPRDVANYCAFLWFHKLSTKPCLRDYIHKRELENTKAFLKYLRETWISSPQIIGDVTRELARLEQLTEGK